MDDSLTTNELILIEHRVATAKKSKGVAYLLWFLFWWVSGHRFYLGKPVTALVQIASYFVLIGFVWVIIDAFLIPGMVDEDNNKNRNTLIQALRAQKASAEQA